MKEKGDKLETTLKDGILTIEIPLEKGKRSHSGKNQLIFTTKGFIPIEGTDLKININVIGKKITA
jgi:hypothetical protein